MSEPPESYRVLAGLAAAVGPALAPIDHLHQLTELVEAARSALGAQACSIALLDDDEENLVFTVASGVGSESVIGLSVPVGVGIAGWVVSSGQSIEVGDPARDPRFARDVAERTGYLPQSILAAPLETETQVLGVVEVLDRDAGRPGSDRDLVLLDFFARDAALAVHSARLFSDMGRLLLRSLAAGTTEEDLAETLTATARELSVDLELAELAGLFGELGRAGGAERQLAVRVMGNVLRYSRERPPL